ncbi:Fic family protein [Nocardia vaccinii]|uniref:Fic family protein n=1 Tax=Nocardia vaccinii TaxID=1822 RepID=UPI00157C4E0C|nr:Fic family protein [Nocardia vaccinii]
MALIEQRSAELGLHTPSQRALESSLFIDEPVHQAAMIADRPQPELLFGARDWAGYLDARAFTRRYGDQELSVPFISELHQRVAQFGMPDAGVFVQGERWFINGKPFTLDEISAIEANPYLIHIHEGTVPLERNIGAVSYRITDPDSIRHELQSLSDWYNEARARPGSDPYRLAAELQQRFISIHPFRDYNGRSSRLLMNWALEREGLSPSILPDFNRDIFSTTDQWTDVVRSGSRTFAEHSHRLQQLGSAADPVQTFGLQRLRELYRNYEGEVEPLEPGAGHDIGSWRELLSRLQADEGPGT